MKGLLVLLVVLALTAGVGAGIGYYLYGDDFIAMITIAEARRQADERQSQTDEHQRDADQPPPDAEPPPRQEPTGQTAPEPPRRTPLPGFGEVVTAVKRVAESIGKSAESTATAHPDTATRRSTEPDPGRIFGHFVFTDPDKLFTADFPGPVEAFQNEEARRLPDLLTGSTTYAGLGRAIIAQVTVLRWRPDATATLARFGRNPTDLQRDPTGKTLLQAVLGDGVSLEQPRRFTAFGRKALELTGDLPNGEGGWHRAVIWLLPGKDDLLLAVIRSFDDLGLLSDEAISFNQSFRLIVPDALPPMNDPVAELSSKSRPTTPTAEMPLVPEAAHALASPAPDRTATVDDGPDSAPPASAADQPATKQPGSANEPVTDSTSDAGR